MKNFVLALVMIALASSALYSLAEEKLAPGNGQAAFEKIKSLAGEWEIKGGAEAAAHPGTVTFKVTAGGSAVLETMFGGTDHEMVTLYYLNGNELELTHYCMLQNRPQMKAEKSSTPAKIVFHCTDSASDKLAKEDHMHAATFNFIDGDRLKTEWKLFKDGKEDSTHSFELKRKKK